MLISEFVGRFLARQWVNAHNASCADRSKGYSGCEPKHRGAGRITLFFEELSTPFYNKSPGIPTTRNERFDNKYALRVGVTRRA